MSSSTFSSSSHKDDSLILHTAENTILCQYIMQGIKYELCGRNVAKGHNICSEHLALQNGDEITPKKDRKNYNKKSHSSNLTKSKIIVTKPIVSLQPEDTLFYSWQKEMWDMLLTSTWDYRRLIWIVGKQGLDGKTTFCDTFTKIKGGITVQYLSGASNLSSTINEEVKKNNRMEYILLDLPYSSQNQNIWDSVEAILNADSALLRYKRDQLELKDPRLVVFSNWDPPFNPEGKEKDFISKYRWQIGDIEDIINAEDNEVDKIIRWRINPHYKPEWVKPKRQLQF
jgi:hypothetical protein